MLRIRNVVKIAQRVRETLRQGVPPDEVEGFKEYVLQTTRRIEEICDRAGATPAQLPTPSRKAYQFLKDIDFGDLPLAESRAGTSPRKTVAVKNVVRNKRAILRTISKAAAAESPDPDERSRIAGMIDQSVAGIERICERHGASPASLPGPSRAGYALLKFLSTGSNLELHLEATRRATRIARAVMESREVDKLDVVVDFTHMNSLWKCGTRGNTVYAEIDEGFIHAPDEVLEAIVRSMLVRKTRAREHLVYDFVKSEEYTDVILELDLAAEVDAEEPRGVAHDLEDLFESVNRDYFGGSMSRPRLAWTRRLTHRKFGYYDPARDRVMLSLTLDDRNVPRFVVEYLVYHELLHRQYPSQLVNGRYRSHTSEFKSAERTFRRYDEAEQWLDKLATS